MEQPKSNILMLKSIVRFGAVSLLAAAIAGMPFQLLGQTSDKTTMEKKPAATKSESSTKKKGAHPFRGKLAAVDKTAKTITVGKSVYQITSETKITKDGKPALLEDGVVGDPVTGFSKPADDGKMVATTVKFGGKGDTKGGEKKKKSSK
jgi:hypothetical protein